MNDFRHWKNGRFSPASAGRGPVPKLDDTGVWRDYLTGAPCDPPPSAFPTARWQIIDTFNGGSGEPKVVFTSEGTGDDGHNECFNWIHQHTSHSFHRATTIMGYVVAPLFPDT
jgi:hypothetical protein